MPEFSACSTEPERLEDTLRSQPHEGSTASSAQFCIEFFCGTAGLTQATQRYLPDSFGIDHIVKRPKGRVIALDLDDPANQALVRGWVLSPACVWIHFGIPCGTSSRARDKPLSASHHGPLPFRSEAWPDGLPHLPERYLPRLRAANRLYAFMRDLLIAASRTAVVWSVENPWRSYLWDTSYWQAIDSVFKPVYVECHHCMFGGERRKATCFAANTSAIQALAVTCDESHSHKPWLVTEHGFDTALEAEYPRELCTALAAAMLSHRFQASDIPRPTAAVAASAQRQACRAVPSIVPEFAQVLTLTSCQDLTLPLDGKQCLAACVRLRAQCGTFVLPCGSKLLRTSLLNLPVGSESVSVTVEKGASWPRCGGSCEAASVACTKCSCVEVLISPGGAIECPVQAKQWAVGVRYSPRDFIKIACDAGHPFNLEAGVPTVLKDCIDRLARMSPAEVASHRCRKLRLWLDWAKELRADEASCKAAMSSERRSILAPKRLKLLARIIEAEGFPDVSLAAELERGFDLVGDMPLSHHLPPKFKPAGLSVAALAASAKKAREAVRHSTRSSGDAAMDKALWDKTLAEVSRGWMVGPIAWETLVNDEVVSKRFPIQQGPKVRPIDDYSMSSINATVTQWEQPTVDTIDTICATVLSCMRAFRTMGMSSDLQCRSLDLSSAYRQLCISDQSAPFAYIAVYDPAAKTSKLFRQVGMPFGSRCSVNAFIRCARCLQWLCAKALLVPSTCYFDDYVILSIPGLVRSTTWTVDLFFDLLGWLFDREGPKADVFSHEVAALGVHLSLAQAAEARLSIRNTDKRCTELVAQIDAVLSAASLSRKDSLVLRGRLAFADAHVFGRAGRRGLQAITRHTYAKPFKAAISHTLTRALQILRSRLLANEPRCLSAEVFDCWYLYTDASFEQDGSGGIGGVLVNPEGKVDAWFGFHLTSADSSPFLAPGQQTAIG